MSSGPGSPQLSPTVQRSKSDSCQPSKIPLPVPTTPVYASPTVTLAASGAHLVESRYPPAKANGESAEKEGFLVVDGENNISNENDTVDSKSDDHGNFVSDSDRQELKVDTLMPASVSNSE